MRRSRREGQTLDEFLRGAKQRSIDGVTVSSTRTHGLTKYTIECDAEVSDYDRADVARRTLEEWWTEAGS
jgi:hypothetical protein